MSIPTPTWFQISPRLSNQAFDLEPAGVNHPSLLHLGRSYCKLIHNREIP